MKLRKVLFPLMWIFLAACLVSFLGIPVVESFLHNFKPDPNNLPLPVAVLMYLSMIFFVLFIGTLIGVFIVRPIENAHLRSTGQPATARVLAIRQTGEFDNNNPVCRFKLQVNPPNGAPFEAVAENVIPYTQLGDIVGATVSVRYDPRTKEVAFEETQKTKEDDF